MLNILDAISAKIAEEYTTYPVYVSRVPQNFTTPSFLVDPLTVQVEDFTRKTVQVTEQYNIVCFVTMDSHGNYDAVELYTLQRQIIDLFSAGYIACGDRCPHVTAEQGEATEGEAYITVTVQYAVDRDGLPDPAPVLQNVEKEIEIKGVD